MESGWRIIVRGTLSLGLALLAGCAVDSKFARMDALERDVRRAIARFTPEARVRLWLGRVDGREILAIDADVPVLAASTLKVLVLVEAHAQALEGTFHWSGNATMREEDRTGGSGSLQYEKAGSTWTYPQLARRMILESDNVASNMLLRRMGMKNLNRRARALGMKLTRFERAFVDREARRAGLENRTTAREMGLLLRALYRKEILTPAACDEIILLLEKTSRGRIATGVPRWIPVGHKGGRLAGLRADVGWVRLEGMPYLLAIYLDNVYESRREGEDLGRDALEAAAAAVYRHLGPTEE